MRQHGTPWESCTEAVLEKYGVAPLIIDNRTYVPIRFVAEELGASVVWDGQTRTVTIEK